MQLDDLQAMAAVISAVCAIVAASVSVLIWRKSKSSDLSARIDSGDRAIRKHTDKAIVDVRAELGYLGKRTADMEDGIARIEVAQQSHLTARDLGLVHEKINRVAEAIAANSATTNAMSEQMKTIQSYILRGKS